MASCRLCKKISLSVILQNSWKFYINNLPKLKHNDYIAMLICHLLLDIIYEVFPIM